VIVRCRPFLSKESGPVALTIKEKEKRISLTTDKRSFVFDYVYGGHVLTAEIYKRSLAAMISSCVSNGYGGTIFCYGQTGSGKTYTMSGAGSNEGPAVAKSEGIMQKVSTQVFDHINAQTNGKCNPDGPKYLVLCSYLEIYKEKVYDLLADGNKRKALSVREENRRGFYVKDLSHHVVKSAEELLKFIVIGTKARCVGITARNKKSSRSHSILTIQIEKSFTQNQRQQIHNTKLKMVDLAGSERLDLMFKSESINQKKEASSINKSLSCLSECIHILSQGKLPKGKKRHIPYRNSTLTKLINIDDHTMTIMICCINPCIENVKDTLATLRYGTRAKMIKGTVKPNRRGSDSMLAKLHEEIQLLKSATKQRHKVQDNVLTLMEILPARPPTTPLIIGSPKIQKQGVEVTGTRFTFNESNEEMSDRVKLLKRCIMGSGEDSCQKEKEKTRLSKLPRHDMVSPASLEFIQQITNKVDEFKSGFLAATKQNTTLRQDISSLMAAKDSLELDNRDMKLSMIKGQNERIQLETEKRQIKQEKDSQEAELFENKTKISILNRSLILTKANLKNRRCSQQINKKGLQDFISNQKTHITRLQDQLKRQLKSIEKQNKRASEINKKFEDAKISLVEAQKTNEALEKYCSKLTIELAFRSRAMKEQTEFMQGFKAQEKNYKNKMHALEQKLEAGLEIQIKLEKEREQKTKEVEEQKEANEALEKYCLKLTKELASRSRAKEEQTKLSNEYKAMEKNFESRIKEEQSKFANEYKAMEKNFESRIKEQQSKFANEYKAMEKSFENRIQVLQQKLEAGYEIQTELEKENEQKSKEFAEQQVYTAEANEKIETAKIDARKLQQKVDAQNAVIQELKEELNLMRKKKTSLHSALLTELQKYKRQDEEEIPSHEDEDEILSP